MKLFRLEGAAPTIGLELLDGHPNPRRIVFEHGGFGSGETFPALTGHGLDGLGERRDRLDGIGRVIAPSLIGDEGGQSADPARMHSAATDSGGSSHRVIGSVPLPVGND